MTSRKGDAYSSVDERLLAVSENFYDGRPSVMQGVLEQGANPNVTDEFGNTPMHFVCKKSYWNELELLLQWGGDVNIVNKMGWTPLHKACYYHQWESLKLLIENGAVVNHRCTIEETPLHLIHGKNTGKGGWEVATLLFEIFENTDITAHDFAGKIRFDNLSSNGIFEEEYSCLEAIKLLIKNGADVNAKNKYGSTPFHMVCENGQFYPAGVMISNGADVNACDNGGETPLLSACKKGQFEMVWLLVCNGANMNFIGKDGMTPFHWACKRGNWKVVQLLLRFGADVKFPTTQGATPLQIASESNSPEVVSLLMKKHPWLLVSE